MRNIKTLIAVLQGKALVITPRDSKKADVVIGKNVDKQFAIGSLVGAVKALML
jgi:hypothetical protein